MKGGMIFGVFCSLLSIIGGAMSATETKKPEESYEWAQKHATPEEKAMWEKIQSILHLGTQVVPWEPLTPPQISQRQAESLQERTAAVEARTYLTAVQAIQTVDRVADRMNQVFDGIAQRAKEMSEKIQCDQLHSKEAFKREMAEWDARSARQAAERTAKFEKERLEREADWDTWYESLKETNPSFYASIIAYRQQHGIPLPGGAVSPSTGFDTAHLSIHYEVLPKSSLEVMGSSDIDFSDVWKEPVPHKTVTLRATTNAPGRIKVCGYFMGDQAGLSNGAVVIPCAVRTENVPTVPLLVCLKNLWFYRKKQQTCRFF